MVPGLLRYTCGHLLSSEVSRYYTGHMSTAQTWQTVSTSSGKTLELAELIGSKLRGGETIELVSDLGGGKTTFVRGLAQGLGSHDNVSSPSFTLRNEYRAGELTLYHFDFYRLHEPGIIRDELAELLDGTNAIVAVEWASIIEDVLPNERLTITLRIAGENSRELLLEYPESLHYLIPDKT
jgi:tRNA threonylcarbamoyladenosine biosynthesis protein TsaE